MHSFYLRLFSGVFCIVALVFGLKLSQQGFENIQDFKQLERIAPTAILGALPGENQLRGRAAQSSSEHVLRSPKTQRPSLYYRYMIERKERDSDGNTRWVTEKDISRSVDFILYDDKAQASVYTANWTEEIQWLLPKRYSRTEGDRRYSEWRIEPDDALLLFSWVDVEERSHNLPEFSLRFDAKGNYLPIISSLTDAEIRGDMGNSALLKIWAGISLLALGVMALTYTLQIHRVLVYLSLLTVVTSSCLFVYGLASLSSDVRTGFSYLQAQHERSEQALNVTLDRSAGDLLEKQRKVWQLAQPENGRWAALEPWQQTRVQLLRQNLSFSHAVYQQQISRFPESLYARLSGMDRYPSEFALTRTEAERLQKKLQQFSPTRVFGMAYWWVLAGALCFLGFTYFAFRRIKVKRMIENIPTTASIGVSVGLAEVKGKIRLIQEKPLDGPVSNQPCVWYRYLIEERRGSGKNARWVKISDNIFFQRFYCEDEEGRLVIDPKGANLTSRHKKVKREGSMRYSEWLLKPGDKLYALGSVNVDPQIQDRLVLGDAEKQIEQGGLFILSNYSEQELMIRKAAIGMLSLSLAFSAMFCSAIFMGGMSGQFSATDYLVSGLLAPIFLIFFMLVLHYNDLIFLQRRALRNWANIQVSLKKRADLLPGLQRILQHYKNYEASLLLQISQQRQQLTHSLESPEKVADYLKSEHHLMRELKLAVEAYPELKSQTLFLSLMTTLSQLENEIALMRSGFNDAVMHYNTRQQSFPDVFLARAFRFKIMSFLE
jgi:hypothetical protein